jgi:hypothetical protein
MVLFAVRFGISRIGRAVGGTLLAATFISGLILEVLALSPVYWRASSFGLDEALIATLALSFLTLPTDFSDTLVTSYANLSGTFAGAYGVF